MKRKKNLPKLLNLQYLSVTNKTIAIGEKDFPKLYCDIDDYPDFIALYSERGLYHKTDKTCVAFMEYDNEWNGRYGLSESIRWDDQEELQRYIERFEGVKYFASPDPTISNDIHRYEIGHRIGTAREVAIWLTMNTKAITIPLIKYSSSSDFKYMLDGLEDVTVVMFSAKGKMNSGKDHDLLIEAANFTVEKLKNLKAIIVYSDSIYDKKILKMFNSALVAGIRVTIPDNTLRTRNMELAKESGRYERL